MTNRLTGGFDVCVELDRSILTALAAPRLLADQRIRRPVLNVSQGPLRATLTLFVTGASLTPVPGSQPAVRVTLPFTESAFAVTAPRADTVGDLDGSVSLTVPVALGPVEGVDNGTRRRRLMIDLTGVRDVGIRFTERSRDALDAIGQRLAVADDALIDGVEAALQQLATVAGAFGSFAVDASVDLAPDGQDGSLDPLKFVDVALTTASTSGPVSETVLVLLGTVLRSHARRGVVAEKQEVALQPTDDAVVIVSPEAFRDAILAPQLLRSLLPIHLGRHVPGDFLTRLPAGAFDRFSQGITDANARREVRNYLAGLRRDQNNQAFFDYVLPRPLPVDATAALGPEVTAALPNDLRALLRNTSAAVRRLLPADFGDADFFFIDNAKIQRVGVHFLDGIVRLDGHILPDRTGFTGSVDFSVDATLTVRDGAVVPEAREPELQSTVDFEWWAYLAAGPLAPVLYAVGDYINGVARDTARETLEQATGQLQRVPLVLPLGVTLRSLQVEPRGLVVRGTAPRVRPDVGQLPEAYISVAGPIRTTRTLPPVTREVDNDCVQGTFVFQRRETQRRYVFTASTRDIPNPRYDWFIDDRQVTGTGSINDNRGRPVLHYQATGATLRLHNEWGIPFRIAAIRVRATGSNGTTDEARSGAYFEATQEIGPPEYNDAVSRCFQAHIRDLDELLAVAPNRIFGGRARSIVEELAAFARRRDPVTDPLVLPGLVRAGEIAGLNNPRFLTERVASLGPVLRRLPTRPPVVTRRPPG